MQPVIMHCPTCKKESAFLRIKRRFKEKIFHFHQAKVRCRCCHDTFWCQKNMKPGSKLEA